MVERIFIVMKSFIAIESIYSQLELRSLRFGIYGSPSPFIAVALSVIVSPFPVSGGRRPPVDTDVFFSGEFLLLVFCRNRI